jgi:hypothetical protein
MLASLSDELEDETPQLLSPEQRFPLEGDVLANLHRFGNLLEAVLEGTLSILPNSPP